MNKFRFTHLIDNLAYPPRCKAKLSILHSDVVNYVQKNYRGSFKERKHIIEVINTLSYLIINNDTIPKSWSPSDPLVGLTEIDDDECKRVLGDLYLTERYLVWDINIEESEIDTDSLKSDVKGTIQESVQNKVDDVPSVVLTDALAPQTPKEDLYIKPPMVPRFDSSKIFASGVIDETQYIIYHSLPEIPKRQNEISATTDVSQFSRFDLLNLFPNHFIQTRSYVMYQPQEGIKLHPSLGLILPINGYSEEAIIDNIIRYPHIFRLTKEVDGDIVSFYPTIELEGELYKVSDIWNSLPESSVIPYNSDFVKEYVVRRYLLERDILGIEHKYPIHGSLDPFLTLFTTPEDYLSFGYDDPELLARKCVLSRVSYKQSRNPIIRKLKDV